VSLAGVSYISSTGIGVLSSAMMEYERIRIPFSICSVPDRVRALFEQLGIWNYFRVEPEAKRDDV
jgi:anti-anti-sigma factor